jgi:hypothetical protein
MLVFGIYEDGLTDQQVSLRWSSPEVLDEWTRPVLIFHSVEDAILHIETSCNDVSTFIGDGGRHLLDIEIGSKRVYDTLPGPVAVGEVDRLYCGAVDMALEDHEIMEVYEDEFGITADDIVDDDHLREGLYNWLLDKPDFVESAFLEALRSAIEFYVM